MASDDRDVTDVLFGSSVQEDVPELGSSPLAHKGHRLSLVIACVSLVATVAARLVVQQIRPSSFQAPWWMVVVAGLVVFALVHRAWGASYKVTPMLVAQTIAVISLLPLSDIALPVPAALLVATAALSRPRVTE